MTNLFQQRVMPVRDKLYRFALRLTGSAHEAEDVVQDVMTKAWKATETPMAATIQNWEAWCMTLARNRSLDLNRSRNLRRTSPIDTAIHSARVEKNTLPDLVAEQADMIEQVRKFMQALPEKQRLIMHLRDVEEMSYDEIAETLEIPLDHVKVNLHRARKTVREQMLTLR